MQTFKLSEIAKRYGWNVTHVTRVAKITKEFLDAEVKSHEFDAAIPKIWIAGGSLRRPIVGQETIDKSDFDFFFSDESISGKFKDFLVNSCAFKVKRTSEQNVELVGSVDFAPYNSDDKVEDVQEVVFQLITMKTYKEVNELLDSFDYTLCQFAIDVQQEDLVLTCGDTSLYDVANKRIVVNKITFAVASLRRLIKYTNQGFYACNGCLTEFLSEVQESEKKVADEKVKYFD